MLLIRAYETEASRAQTMARAIDGKFDSSFTDEPHLRVDMMVRGMRISIRGQSRLVRFHMFPGCEFAFHNAAELCVVRFLHRQAFKGKARGRQRIVVRRERGNSSADAHERWDELTSISPCQSHIHLSKLVLTLPYERRPAKGLEHSFLSAANTGCAPHFCKISDVV